jgi:hypothetical protein
MRDRPNLTNSKLSFIHVGLPLDHPSIPIEIRKEASVQLPLLIDRMQAEGYGYELVFASPEGGLENFKSQLGARGPDGVVIGGGVVGNPQMRFFMEQIIDVIRTSAPRSKILLIGRPEEAPAAVARWFPKT